MPTNLPTDIDATNADDPNRPTVKTHQQQHDIIHGEINRMSAGILVATTQTAAYTFALADAGTLVEVNSASAVTLTVPANATVAFPIGTSIGIRQYGAGQVTIAPATGVTIRSRGDAFKTAGQYAEAVLTKRAADEWILTGDLVA